MTEMPAQPRPAGLARTPIAGVPEPVLAALTPAEHRVEGGGRDDMATDHHNSEQTAAPASPPSTALRLPPLPALPSRQATTALPRPDVQAARAAVLRVLPGMFQDLWPGLLTRAGLTGTETDQHSMQRLLEAMRTSGVPVLNLCAVSLTIRLATHEHFAS